MAFPTSGLTNNLVHKEGNRAFVYDSALGVWDQVRETERTENKILQGEIGTGVTFPTGHVISKQISSKTNLNGSADYSINTTTRTAIDDSIAFSTISGNTYLIEVSCRIYIYDAASTAARRGYVQLSYDANVAQAATSLGTQLSEGMFGRYLVSATGTDAYSFDDAKVWGAFVADATETNYFTVSGSTDTTSTRLVFDASANSPQTYTVTGFQGDVFTLNP